MAIHNYAFNNLDAKLSNDSYWDFFLSSDQRDFNQEVIYSTEIISYSAQTELFDSTFYSSRLPVYMDFNDPQCSKQLEKKDLSSLGGIKIVSLGAADSDRTEGNYYIYSHCPEPGTFNTTNLNPTIQGHSNYNCESNYMNWYNGNAPVNPVQGQGASFWINVDGSGLATISGSSAYFTAIDGGYGYQPGDLLIVPDSSLGGGGAADLYVTVVGVNGSDTEVENEGVFYSANTVLSKMAWNQASVTDSQVIRDIGLTGIDNGLTPTLTGQTANLATSIPTSPVDHTFNPHWYDYRMKMHQVTGYTAQFDRYAAGTIKSISVYNATNANRVAGTYNIKTTDTGVIVINTNANASNAEFQVVVDGDGTTTTSDITVIGETTEWSINDLVLIPGTLLGWAGGAADYLIISVDTASTVEENPTLLPNPVTYGMRSDYDRSGFHYQLYGGWFQGFYNFFSFGYQVLPKRVDKGWTVECLLKVRSSGSSWNVESATTVNTLYPNNEGLFFYLGTRSENKFWNCYGGETGYTTSDNVTALYNCTGSCIHTGLSADTCQSAKNYECTDSECTDEVSCIDPEQCNSTWEWNGTNTGWTYDKQVFNGDFYTSAQTEYQIMSNNFALRLSGGPEYGGYKLGYRALRFTGDTAITGTSDSFACSGGTYATGYTIEEAYSSRPICTGLTKDSWIKVDAVFKRNNFYATELQKLWKGGTNLITTLTCEEETIEMSGSSATTTNIIEGEKLFLQNIAWTGDKSNRVGDLTLYVNSRPVLKVENFEEIIPRRLNELPQKQLSEPFNMSWGGGSQGLYESLTLSGTPGDSSILHEQLLTGNVPGTSRKSWNPIIYGDLWAWEGSPACTLLYCSTSWSNCVAGGIWTNDNNWDISSAHGTGLQWIWNLSCEGAAGNAAQNGGTATLNTIPYEYGSGWQVGDSLSLKYDATGWNQPQVGYEPFIATVVQTGQGTITEDTSDQSITLNTTSAEGVWTQNNTLYYKEMDYKTPVISGETYDVFVDAYKVSGNTTFNMGISATTASTSPFNQPNGGTPGPEVKYFWQNQELQSFSGETLLYYSYKATLTGDLFLGITPGTIGEIVIKKVVFSKQVYRRDIADEQMLIQRNFNGSFMGGLSQMRFYTEPLDASELIHNYYTNMERYGLYDCICGNANFPVEGCDTEYAIYTFPTGIDTISLDFGFRMIRWDYEETENITSWSGTSNNHDIPLLYSSQEPYCTDQTTIQPFLSETSPPYGGRPITHKCLTQADCVGTGFGQCGGTWHDDGTAGTAVPPRPKFPFTIVPNKPFSVTVTRTDPLQTAKITFTGKRVR